MQTKARRRVLEEGMTVEELIEHRLVRDLIGGQGIAAAHGNAALIRRGRLRVKARGTLTNSPEFLLRVSPSAHRAIPDPCGPR